MDVKKLFKAASLIKESRPDLSVELTKIAQDISDMQPQPEPGLNPNIKNYAQPMSNPERKKVHKVTFSVEVPENWGELEIMNQLMPTLKELSERDPQIEIKGYQFTQS